MTTPLPFHEIQGLIASGYADQRAMCCVLLRIVDATQAKTWLTKTLEDISFSDNRSNPSKRNIAFTFSGLQQLANEDELLGFSREFCEGIVTPHRQRVLGDLPGSPSDPTRWRWGGPGNDRIDVLLLIYELNSFDLESRLQSTFEQIQGVQVVTQLRSTALKGDKEHFGFRDGLSQPWIQQLHKEGYLRDRVAAGEFILGHNDNTDALEPAPWLAANGSYLVLRQIAQRVPEFWNSFGDASNEERVRQASLRVGRWPDGTPLTLSPQAPDTNQSLNDFGYAKLDSKGLQCPIGAHIRRSNSRDALLPDASESLLSVNRHRLLRRGRTFGLPADSSIYPSGVEVLSEDAVTGAEDLRGILFMCLNASLSRQFEFVQQSWLNNPKFTQSSAESDPIASQVQWNGPDETPSFTAPARPIRHRSIEQEKYVYTVGGGYFFLPSRTAILALLA